MLLPCRPAEPSARTALYYLPLRASTSLQLLQLAPAGLAALLCTVQFSPVTVLLPQGVQLKFRQ